MGKLYLLVGLAYCLPGNLSLAMDEQPVSFRRDIAPVLIDSCLACHGPKKAEGGYRVDSYEELLKAGDSGEPPISDSSDQESELLRRITCEDDSERMPAESDALTSEQIELFEAWIAAGAKFDGKDHSQRLELVIPPVRYAAPPKVYQHAIPITAATFTPDGQLLLTGGYHELLVWNVQDGSLVRRIDNIGQRIFDLAFSPDAMTLAVACGTPGRSGEVRLVDFDAGTVTDVLARSDAVVLDLAFRPGANQLAIASADSTIRIVDTESLQTIRSIASHADWVTAIAWSDDGKLLASASRDKSAKTYDGATGELLSSYLGHGAPVRGVSILPDNGQAATVGIDGKLHRWNITDAKKLADISLGGEGNRLLRHGNSLFVPCSSHRLIRIDLATNKISTQFEGHHDWVLAACIRPSVDGEENGGVIATGSFNGEVRIWKIADGSTMSHWIAKP